MTDPGKLSKAYKRLDLNSEIGMTRRDLIRRGAVVGTLVWVAPAISSITQPAFAASAAGGSAKIYKDSDAYSCSGGAGITTTETGQVTISATATQVFVSASVTGLTPNTSYDLWVNQDPGGCPLGSPSAAGWLTTDGSGNGSAGPTPFARVGGATKAWISFTAGSEIHRSGTVSI